MECAAGFERRRLRASTWLTLLLAFAMAASPALGQQRAAYGLDQRPSNDTCLAFDRISPSGGITVERVFQNLPLGSAVALGQAPGNDDYWYVVSSEGRLWRFENRDDVTTKEVVLDIRSRTKVVYDGGLINFVFHPDFPTDPRVFVNYSTPPLDGVSDADIVLASFSLSGDGVTFDPATEVRLIRQKRTTFHQGGFMVFDPQGMLVAAIGDGTAQGDPDGHAQNLGELRGNVLRLDVDNGSPYAIPADNPFAGSGGDPLEEIWAWGFRNPYGGDIDTLTGEMWLGDVGFTQREEVDRLVKGGNFGWNVMEGTRCFSEARGSCDDPSLIPPEIDYAHTDGNCAVIGGVVYRGQALPQLQGRFIFGDYCSAKVSVVEYDGLGVAFEDIIIPSGSTGLGQITAFGRDLDGEAYVVTGSSIYRIVPAGGSESSGAPSLLSETGCFEPADPTVPMPGLVPFDMNAPLWSDDATKRRYMALPNGAAITLDAEGDFEFPRGTVLVKEFSMDGEPVETRLLVHHDDGVWAGYSYEWIGGDAVLLQTSKRKILPGGKAWNYPSRGECLRCHTQVARFSLGPEVQQLNGDFVYPQTNRLANQLSTLDHIGLIAGGLDAPITELSALSAIDDLHTSASRRSRSYLHSNCSNCHRPDGPTQAAMDFRFSTPSASANMCDGIPAFGDLGVSGARILKPGDPASSVMRLRPGTTDPGFRMPPLGTEIVHTAAMDVFDEWIESASVCDPFLDIDGDGIAADQDNCPSIANASQYDSDQDGIGDRCDVDHSGDADGDGLIDGEEAIFGTDAMLTDTDGDGFDDGLEVVEGSDPLDSASTPQGSDPDFLLHYTFDGDPGTGVVVDASGHGHDGLCQPGANCPTHRTDIGQPPGSASLTAAGDMLVVQGESDFDFTTEFSVAAWIRTGPFGSDWAQIVGKGDSAWSLDSFDRSDQLAFTTWSGSPDTLVGTTAVTDGAWHHVAIVYDGAQKRLYVDGAVDAQTPYSATLATNDIPVHIGQNAEYAPGAYDGFVDDVRIYGRALSASEVSALFSGGTPPTPTISAPAPGLRFQGGTSIAFSGSASDAEDGALAPSALRFDVVLDRDGVIVPVATAIGVASGSFDVPTDGSAFLGNVQYEVRLQATDSDGAIGTTSIVIAPERSTLDFDSVPSGLGLRVDGVARTTPFSLDSVAGMSHTVEAVNSGAGDQLFTFAAWSDLGAQSHAIAVPVGGAAFVATFDVTLLDPTGDEDGDGLSNGFELDGGLDPFDASDAALDGDGDGLDNLEEQAAGTDPASADTDADTLDDGAELALGTDPLLADTDGDGFDDGTEIAAGSNPLDPASIPAEPPSGLILHYAFDSSPATGVVTDLSGAGHDGQCTAGSTCPGFRSDTGQPPGAASFVGANDRIVVSGESAFDFTSDFSVAAWIQTGAFAKPWAQLVGKGDSAWSVDRFDDTDLVAFTTWSGGAADTLVGTTPVTDGAWHHVAVVYDGAEKRLYVDGALDASKAYGATLAANDIPVQIGQNAEYAPGQYDGLMDDVRVYERALSAAEVAALASPGTPPAPVITTPGVGQRFQGGTSVSFSGSASDAEDGSLPASSLRWDVLLERDGVITPVATALGVASGSFAVPTDGSAHLGDVRYEVRLQATDSDGAMATTSVVLEPERSTLDFDSVPSGLVILVDGIARTTPFGLDSVAGMAHTVEAVSSGAGSQLFTFASWTDGGAQSHAIDAPVGGALYVALFDVTTLDPVGDEDGDGLSNGFELDGGLDPFDPADAGLDGDGDGLDNLEEQAAGTHPAQADTDVDGLDDGAELVLGTDPLTPDSDGDGYDDGAEIAAGSDPLDAGSVPVAQSQGLILHYSFDADPSGGTVIDESGQGHDGQCQPGATCPTHRLDTGVPAGSASLIEAGDLVVVPNESAFDFTGPFSVSVWIKTGTFSTAWAQIIGKGDSAWSIDSFDRSAQVAFTTWAGSPDTLVGTTPVTDGAWHHIAAVYDGAQKRLYVDGVLDAQVAYSATLATNDVPVQLGQNAEYAPGHYDALMDEVRIYDRALTPAEVGDLTQQGAP